MQFGELSSAHTLRFVDFPLKCDRCQKNNLHKNAGTLGG